MGATHGAYVLRHSGVYALPLLPFKRGQNCDVVMMMMFSTLEPQNHKILQHLPSSKSFSVKLVVEVALSWNETRELFLYIMFLSGPYFCACPSSLARAHTTTF